MLRMTYQILALVLLMGASEAATLEQIRAVSDRLRVLGRAPSADIVRTVPEHAELRRLLVEWAEPEFVNDPSVGSSTLDARLSAQRNVAGLMQPSTIKDSPEFGDFGTVKALKLFHPQGDRDYLVPQTGRGILCGTSYAHYLYRLQGARWVRVLALEPVESDGFYLPDVVMLKRRNGAGDALFMVGGADQWCSSRFGRIGAKRDRGEAGPPDPTNGRPDGGPAPGCQPAV